MTPGMGTSPGGAFPASLLVGEIPPISQARDRERPSTPWTGLEIVAPGLITRSLEGEPMTMNVERSTNWIPGACLVICALLAGCGNSQASPAPSSSTGPQPSVAVSVGELPSPPLRRARFRPSRQAPRPPSRRRRPPPQPTVSLYVRMWYVNASVGPSNFFFSSLAISGGSLYYTLDRYSIRDDTQAHAAVRVADDGNHQPGRDRMIVARIEQDGLLGPTHGFECAGDPNVEVAGAGTTFVRIVIDGVTHDLSGGCDKGPSAATPAPVPAPGTYDAFEDLVSHLGDMSGWLGDELGTPSAWDPTSMAVIADLPGEALWEGEIWGHPDPSPGTARWQLGTWAHFGKLVDASNTQERCAVVSGADLTTQLPAIKTAHAGAVFLDTANQKRVLAVRPLLPNEPPPSFCA